MIDITLTEEQRIIKDVVEKFTEKEIAPIASDIDEEEKFPEEIFRKKMGEAGLLGVLMPREYGGADAGTVAATVVIEVISKVSASVGLSFAAHAVLCANNLKENCNPEQKERYLPPLISGEAIGAMALTEPEAGSDAMGITTTAVNEGDEFILNGTKTLITNGPVADIFLVYAKSSSCTGRVPMSAFIVEKNFPGFSVGKKIPKMGMRGSPISEVIFDDCRVPFENLVGKEGQALKMLWTGLNVERVTLSGICLGILHSCLDTATQYAKERRQFGKPIAEFQMIQKMIADMSTNKSAAHLMIYYAAQEADKGRRINREAAEAKLFSSEAATKAALDTIQILGGYGYTREFQVERWMRDAKLMEIGAGTSQIMRYIIAKEILSST